VVTTKNYSICLVASGLSAGNFPLQPWRFLGETARQLANRGHRVSVITDIQDFPTNQDLQIEYRFIKSISNPTWHKNRELTEKVRTIRPDFLLLNLGFSSLLHQRFDWWDGIPSVAILTSPIYRLRELSHLGFGKLFGNFSLSGTHLLNASIPFSYASSRIKSINFRSIVVQTHTLEDQVKQLWPGRTTVIHPGVDKIWCPKLQDNSIRGKMGFSESNCVFVYFGSVAPLRGLPTLLQAFQNVNKHNSNTRLLVLMRQRLKESMRNYAQVEEQPNVKFVPGFLNQQDLVEYVSASDFIVFPYELVPSDGPLSLLEAKALGKFIITTRTACLPELVAGGLNLLAEPGDPVSLSHAMMQAIETKNIRPTLATRNWEQVGSDWEEHLDSL
jgi:glycosyltransferase involved in cell wall biosynthesis